MVSFSNLEFHKKQSVYQQLILFLKHQILSGNVSNYEEMPSRRELAVQLSINPNTVQKAYKILEEEGMITTISNVKSVVLVNEVIQEKIREEFSQDIVLQFVKDCKDSGISFQKTVELLTKYWDQ